MVDLYRDISSQTAKAMDCLLPNWRSNLAAISRSTVLEHKKDVLMYMARPGTNAQEVLRGLAYEDSHIYELEFESTFTTYLSQPQRRFLSYSEFAERHRLSSAQDPGQHRLTRFNFVVLLDRTKWALLDSTDPRHHFDHYRQRLEAPGDPVSELGMRFEASKKRPDSSYDIEARLFRGSGRPSYLVKNLVIERQVSEDSVTRGCVC